MSIISTVIGFFVGLISGVFLEALVAATNNRPEDEK